jgi:hypothetical protein
LRWLEVELPNIRKAWLNVKEKSQDATLIIAYGELAWKCYDLQERRVSELLRSIEARQSLESKLGDSLIHDFSRELSEIARLAQLTSSALSPSSFAVGERSVASASIIDSIVITGDNAIVHIGQAREHSSNTSL